MPDVWEPLGLKNCTTHTENTNPCFQIQEHSMSAGALFGWSRAHLCALNRPLKKAIWLSHEVLVQGTIVGHIDGH